MVWKDPGRILIVVGFTLTPFSTLVVALRLYSRHVLLRAAGWTDWFMALAVICTWMHMVVNYWQTTFGRQALLSQIENNPSSETLGFLHGVLITWFLYRPLYTLNLTLVKTSILLFLRSLCPHDLHPRLRLTTTIFIAFVLAYTVAMILTSILQCDPISAAYSVEAYKSQVPGAHLPRPRCYKPTNFFIFQAAFNLFTDLCILFLPMPIILSLRNLSTRKRLGLFFVFGIGALAIAASVVRLWILVPWQRTVESQNALGTALLTWGQVEVNAGIVSASAPFLRPVFRRMVSREVPRTQERKPSTVALIGKADTIGGKEEKDGEVRHVDMMA